ncbi:MAG TPA: adenosylhomocysteinase [Solirubrobacteraceae bacterium]|nr:adenosylhomocysteinase [Solirubrobacteraceae bacterium]
MATSASRSLIADPTLASAGQARIEWAEAQMPLVRSIAQRFGRDRQLAELRVAACLHVTAETANLALALQAGGAEVLLCAANPLSTQDDTAAALVERHGIQVRAVRGEGPDAYQASIQALVSQAPQVTLDDGADLIGALHAGSPDLLEGVLGATEETTSGLVRVRALESAGRLGCPVFAVNEARTERAFNDRYGTGQSTLDGILRATHLLLAGQTVVVLGYGWTGQGVALRARGAGASVIVCEVDPLRALEARMEGFDVMPALSAAERGDVFITVTGMRRVLTSEHFERMKDGAVLANAGHFDVEIDVPALRQLAADEPREVRPLVEQFELPGRRLHLLAGGRVVNLAAGEGHPAAVMDMSFATQALCVQELVRSKGGLEHRVLAIPDGIDQEIARLKLAALGVEIDELTAEQRSYLSAWDPEAE